MGLSFALQANGPEAKAITVDSVKITLKKQVKQGTKEKSYTLINSPQEDDEFPSFPSIIRGGDAATHHVLFEIDDELPNLIARYDEWFDTFSNLLPDRKKEIQSIKNEAKEPYLPVRKDSQISRNLNNTAEGAALGVFALLNELNDGERRRRLIDKIQDLLRDLNVEQFKQVLFFLSGRYEMQIEALDPSGKSLAIQKREFSIGETLSQALRHRFDQNILIRTRQTDFT